MVLLEFWSSLKYLSTGLGMQIGFEGETCMVPLVLTCKLLYCRVTLVLVLSCVHVTDKTAAGSKHTCRMEQSSLESER